ncbi:MAG: hypothetical protein ACOYID_04165 [Eubacteriales bacterium]
MGTGAHALLTAYPVRNAWARAHNPPISKPGRTYRAPTESCPQLKAERYSHAHTAPVKTGRRLHLVPVAAGRRQLSRAMFLARRTAGAQVY